MEKLVYALWGVHEGLVENTAPELLSLEPHGLTVNIVDPEIDMSATVAVPDNGVGATVNLWLGSLDDRGPYEAVLGGAADRVAGYLVTESVPLEYEQRNWPDGERSPGVKQITMFDKRSDIDDTQFFARWHGSHTPQGSMVGPPCPSGPMQFSALATRRAVEVLPTPRTPVSRKAWAIRPRSMALPSVFTIASWPISSAKVCGRYLRARTR